MISRYSATLALVVFLTACALSSLEFATRSQILRGKTVDESLLFEFTIDADNDNTYKVTPSLKQFLEENVRFHADGPARVLFYKIEITPKDVSWTQNRTRMTSTGAGMSAQIKWDTPADSANGAHGYIYLDFPAIPGFEGATTTFHSGGYQKDDAGRYVVREVTAYGSPFQVTIARLVFALSVALPFGILLHTIYWIFVLKNERRARIAAFPPQGTGLPQTYYPNPISEWSIWLLVFGISSLVACVLAGLSVVDGFMSSGMMGFTYAVVAVAAAIAAVCAYFSGRNALTVRVASDGIAYARGRADLQWLNAAWSGISTVVQRSRTYRGNTTYWVEVQFSDNRKKLKIGQSIEGYPSLRDTLISLYSATRQG